MGPFAVRQRSIFSLCLLAALACGEASTDVAPGEARRPNVLLISVDTLRADHLGSYGYPRGTTPHLDSFAEGAIRYAEAWAPAPWTFPSHVALLTGRHPSEIEIRDMKSHIPDTVPTLAEHFAAAGYRTAAFVDSTPGGFVGGRRGFARGFDTYEHAPFAEGGERKYDVARTVSKGIEWLERSSSETPFFLFLHTKSAHSLRAEESAALPKAPPYDAPEPFRSRFGVTGPAGGSWLDDQGNAGSRYLRRLNEQLARGEISEESISPDRRRALRALYDVGIAYVDDQIGRLLAALDEAGLRDDTLVAITSDHGEAFLEHRLFLHKELHREVLHIPLLVALPRRGAERERTVPTGVVEAPVALQDLAPALLAHAGLAIGSGMYERALPIPGEAEPPAPRDLFSYAQWEEGQYYNGFSLRRGRYALIEDHLASEEHYQVRLYDMEADPGEDVPIDGEAAAELLEALQAWSGHRTADGQGGVELDAETLENLRSLGYLE